LRICPESYRLQQARLAGVVLSDNQIHAAELLDLQVAEGAKVLDAQAVELEVAHAFARS
jgi:hypothetical protein